MSHSLQPHGLYSPWNSPGQNAEVGSCSLLQGIFPPRNETSSPTLQTDSLLVEPPGKQVYFSGGCPDPTDCSPYPPWILQARILEWIAISFSSGSSQPRSPALQADSLPTELQRKHQWCRSECFSGILLLF